MSAYVSQAYFTLLLRALQGLSTSFSFTSSLYYLSILNSKLWINWPILTNLVSAVCHWIPVLCYTCYFSTVSNGNTADASTCEVCKQVRRNLGFWKSSNNFASTVLNIITFSLRNSFGGTNNNNMFPVRSFFFQIRFHDGNQGISQGTQVKLGSGDR